jgi:hypothetical protein
VRSWVYRWRWSLRRCCRELDKRGIQSRSGKPWHPESVRRLLRARSESGQEKTAQNPGGDGEL